MYLRATRHRGRGRDDSISRIYIEGIGTIVMEESVPSFLYIKENIRKIP